jgi:hypothetical protein
MDAQESLLKTALRPPDVGDFFTSCLQVLSWGSWEMDTKADTCSLRGTNSQRIAAVVTGGSLRV